MDLSMQQTTEVFEYRHKKFDVHKRPREDDDHEGGDAIKVIYQQRIPTLAHQQPAVSPNLYAAERADTPFSTSSNCSSDYGGFMCFFNAASTPMAAKRRRLFNGSQYTMASVSRSEDSGISLANTPRRMLENQKRRELKRKLTSSALSAEMNGKRSVDVEMIPSTVIDLTAKRRRIEEKITKINELNNVNKAATIPLDTDIKAALEPALKPTPAGILEITTTTTAAAGQTLPTTAATVLSRISEDKLRSICTYHGNMVRQFPKKERTPKDQERRNKNTIACRMSRRLKKLQHIAVEVQLKESEREYMKLMEEWLRVKTFVDQLEQLTASGGACCENENESDKKVKQEDEELDIDVVSVCNDEKDDLISIKSESMTNGTTYGASGAWKYQNNEHLQAPRRPCALMAPAAVAAASPMPLITSAYSIAYLMGSLTK